MPVNLARGLNAKPLLPTGGSRHDTAHCGNSRLQQFGCVIACPGQRSEQWSGPVAVESEPVEPRQCAGDTRPRSRVFVMTSDDLPVASEIEEVDVAQQQQDVQIFQAPDGQIRLDVTLQQGTVWLTQAQMTVLFERDQSVISRHVNNVFKDGELSAESNMQKMHIARSDKPTACYSLDVIISVGYRVKSQRGVQFRQWATGVLRQHLVDGYTLNQQRLEEREVEVEQALDLLSRTLANQQLVSAKGEAVLQVIAEYARSWSLLQGYDERSLSGQSKRAGWSECSAQFVQN